MEQKAPTPQQAVLDALYTKALLDAQAVLGADQSIAALHTRGRIQEALMWGRLVIEAIKTAPPSPDAPPVPNEPPADPASTAQNNAEETQTAPAETQAEPVA